MCTLITSKGTDIDENIANQNHATRTRTPKPGYLNLSITSGRYDTEVINSAPIFFFFFHLCRAAHVVEEPAEETTTSGK